jgi:hypothetical protein
MRTRTAPSERPSTPAISAVDISSTKRRISARRRSSGGDRPRTRPLRPRPCARRRVRRRRRRRPNRPPRAALPGAVAACGVARRRRCARSGRARPGRSRRPRRRPACALLEPPEVRQGGEERALGGVLRLVVVAQLVEGVAVHLGQVLPIEGLEAGRVRLGLLDEPSVTVEVDETRTTLLRTVHLPECRASHLVTRGPWSVRSGGRG